VTEPDLVAIEGEPLTRAFYDIAQLLESAETSEVRVTRVLERLQSFVPYERCAVLDALPGREPRLVVSPGTPVSEVDELRLTVSAILARLNQDHGDAKEQPASVGQHLAVPLVGLDEVVGVLFVRRTDGGYQEPHLRALSVVAAKLAAYFSMLRARDVEAGHIRQLAQARQAAEIANRAKDEFLALVSHELRTPLSTILTWADALRSTDVGVADRARAFEAIERNVLAQTKLIQDLLDLSCVAAAAIRLELQAVEPAKLIREALRSLGQQAKQKAITLDVSLDESVTPLIADPHRLTQIVANLVTNAIKFTPKGGRVEVRLDRAGMLARIQVIDSGSGIGPEVLPTLFTPFRQANSSSTRPYSGLGVGLALVKDLVELHGGRVRAQSEGEQRGATFTVELPWCGADGFAASPALVAERVVGALAGIRVLVVDDDEDTCEAIRMTLEDEGAVVAVATSVGRALEALELSLPDVILSDITMPGESGYDLMRKVVSQRGEAAPPAAAISGGGRNDSAQLALASGFRMLLQKPVHSSALVGAVATLAKMASTGGAAEARLGNAAP
jgi:signal transduction histidine kinase/CheY-like chemotaxis protein